MPKSRSKSKPKLPEAPPKMDIGMDEVPPQLDSAAVSLLPLNSRSSGEQASDTINEGAEGAVQEMADHGETNSYFSMDEENKDDTIQTNTTDDFGNRPLKEPKCSESTLLEVDGAEQEMADRGEVDSFVSTDEEKKDQTVETATTDEVDSRPLKKAKCSESTVLGDPLPPPFLSTSPLVSASFDSIDSSDSDDKINGYPLPSAPPTMLNLSPGTDSISEERIFADNDDQKVSADDEKLANEPKHITNDLTYDYLPQDYTLTELDHLAQCVIVDSKEEDILVTIDDISVKQHYLVCLLDQNKWLDDQVISAYICCMKDKLQVQNDAKVYFENPFVTRLLKRDGEIGIDGPALMTTNVVKNYLNHDLIHLPINITNSHWYLASINVEKREIQVLDSLCWKFNRGDLTTTLQGLQYHLDILKSQVNLSNHKWKDLDVTKWMITEQIEKPIQKDSSSCGLFLLKFMEYWTGKRLSSPVTQEIITSFRFKLAAILLCWERNRAPPTTTLEEIDYSEGHPDDVIMLDSPFDQNHSKDFKSSSFESKYKSLMSVLSSLNIDELVGGLCNYIKSINSAEALEKVWVESSKPYPISLTLKQLQEMLNDELPMDRDCFNLVVRTIMSDDIQKVKKRRGFVSKHYLDMQFWMITDFGRHPDFRKKLDVDKLANSVRSWPGIKYNVSACKSIHIPIQSGRDFILFILDKDTRTVNILDPTPIDPIYKRNQIAKYVHRLLWLADYLPKAMSKAWPGSTWNENILLWQQNIVHDVSGYKRELSGYLVTLFMSTWEDEKVHMPYLKDGYEVRKQSLRQLLTFKENECEDNIPAGVKDFISCIRKIESNKNVNT